MDPGLVSSFWRGKRVLVTGHSGFKGSWLCLWLASLGAEPVGFSAGVPSHPALFELLGLDAQMSSTEGDVRDAEAVFEVVERERPEIVFHLAAESLVTRSLASPALTYEVNAMGTVNVLEAALLARGTQRAPERHLCPGARRNWGIARGADGVSSTCRYTGTTRPMGRAKMPVVESAPDVSHRARRAASLSNDAVHLWHADLDSPASRLEHLRRSLVKDERMRAGRLRSATGRERFVAARGILREILALYLNSTAVCLRIRQRATGKPFLVDHRHLRFNISHTAGTMLVAVAREREIGVDIERLEADAAIGELSETTLSMPERRVLERLDGESMRAAFLAFWTRKEALVKADGRGLSLRLPDIDVSGPTGLVKRWDETTGAWARSTRWLVQTPACDAAHVAAVAAEGRDWHIARRRWPEDLADTPSESHGDS